MSANTYARTHSHLCMLFAFHAVNTATHQLDVRRAHVQRAQRKQKLIKETNKRKK